MRKLLMLAIMLIAGSAFAGAIYDMNTGVYLEGDIVTVDYAVVTAIRDAGFSCTENANGPYGAVWVYVGTGNVTVVLGDEISMTGEYVEYYGLTEMKNLTDLTVLGNAPVAPAPLLGSELNADHEAYESAVIVLTEQFVIVEILNYGMWSAENAGGDLVLFDDYWYDESGLAVDDCFVNITGMFTYSYDEFKMNPFEDGMEECSVAAEAKTFSSLKALY